MRRDQLLRLDAVATRPLTDLSTTDPELADSLRAVAAESLRAVVTERLAGASPELRAAVEDAPLGVRERGRLADDLLAHLATDGRDDRLLEEARVAAAKLTPEDDAQTAVQPDAPVASNPVFAPLLAQARMHRLAAIADVPEATTDAVLARGASAERLDDPTISSLVDTGELSSGQARRLGFVTSLYRLLDGDTVLTERLVAPLDAIADGRFGAVRRLVTVGDDTWRQLLEETGLAPADGSAAPDYAHRLRRKIEAAFPTDAVVARIEAMNLRAFEAQLEAARPALAAGVSVAGNEPPDLSAIPEDERPAVEAGLFAVRAAVNALPGLGLGAMLADTGVPAADRLADAQSRVETILRAVDDNPDVEFLRLDLSVGSPDLERLRLDALAEEDRPRVIETLKAYQRAHGLTGDAGTATALLAAGYDSATRIASAGRDEFLARSGLPPATAARTFEAALTAMAPAVHTVGAVLEATSTAMPEVVISSIDPSVAAHFRRIDGYEDLFGSQDYCRCEHCSSLFSPAAYFVDLMRYVEKSLLAPVFGTATDHPLHLRSRRPDLWRLELTCANTETEIPVLQIVNEILERDIAARSGFAGDPGDEAAIWRLVYGDVLAAAEDSFAQPFNLALERLRIYLVHSRHTRGEIAALVGASGDVRAVAALGLSAREGAVIATPDTDLDALSSLYGIAFTLAPGGDFVTPFDAQDLLRALGVERGTIDALLASRFVSAVGDIAVQGERRDASSVQNDIERVHGARPDSLDRLHRLTRLHRRLAALEHGPAWSVAELDLVVAELGGSLDAAALRRLASSLDLGRRLELRAEPLVALVAGVPMAPFDATRSSLFDRLFNLPDFVRLGGGWPRDDVDFVLPALRDDPAAGPLDYALPRLLGGLRVRPDVLERLVRGLAGPLGIPAAAFADPPGVPEPERGFGLSVANLSLLYRHAPAAPTTAPSSPTATCTARPPRRRYFSSARWPATPPPGR